jgi:CheY-like chemotaxis protein
LIQPLPVGQRRPEREQATILVVEDEVLIRIVLADELRMAGFHALEAADADEALVLLAAAPEIALVFTDIRMPGSMDGLELSRHVRARWPHVKVIVASGAELPVHAEPSWDATLQKPYDVPDVLGSVRALLGGTQTSAGRVAETTGATVLDPGVRAVTVADPAAPAPATPDTGAPAPTRPGGTTPDAQAALASLTADAIRTMPIAAIANVLGIVAAGNGAPSPDVSEAIAPAPPIEPA